MVSVMGGVAAVGDMLGRGSETKISNLFNILAGLIIFAPLVAASLLSRAMPDMKPQDTPTFGKQLSPWKRGLLVVAGTLSLGLGILGIPLPLLPTTPFLLLSAWCYARSSERFYYWLINHRVFGRHIRNYREQRGMSRKLKWYTIGLLWLTIGISATFAVSLWWVRALLLVIAVGVTLHINSLKSLP